MKAAIRLEISKKDEEEFLKAISNYMIRKMEDKGQKDLIHFYRTKLHTAFKMGLEQNHTTNNNVVES